MCLGLFTCTELYDPFRERGQGTQGKQKLLTISELLGTDQGIEALAEFLMKTGAFTRSGSIPTDPSPPDFSNEPDPNMDEPRLVQDDRG